VNKNKKPRSYTELHRRRIKFHIKNSVKLRDLRGLFLLLSFFSFLSQIQPQTLDPQTADAFRATCARIAKRPYTLGTFDQEKTVSRSKRTLKSSGNFIIAADQGMVWDTVKPFPSTMTLGRDYMIQSRPNGQKTVLNAQGNETFVRMAEILSAIFSGNAQGLLENFNIDYRGETAAWVMILSPLETTLNTFAEKIVINGDTAITTIQIYEQNGDSVKYILSNHRYPAELNAHEKAFFAY